MSEMDIDDPNQPTVTEELLQIIEEFAEYIDKFMFEIVTFLAVIDSSMGLIKDVLAMFGFSGWKMTFFPTFSFIVTIGVFLFGTNKRKGKRQADAAELEGLGKAMDMLDDVLGVVDDVVDEVEKVECEAGGLGLGDYSDSDEDDDENPNKTEIKEGETTDVVVDIEVAQEENQEPSQQDAGSEPPQKSSIAKAVGIIVLVAGIVAKLKKGKKQETDSPESNDEDVMGIASNESQNSPAGLVTGAQGPPADAKSKLSTDTCTSSTPQDDTLAEIATDFKQESIELASAVKDESIRATTVAGHIAHDSTLHALHTTGALKVGHGLYREVDFISGHLKKEGIAAGKSLEKETIEVANQVKENKVLKETGIDKLGTGVYREAAFIGGHLSQGTKKVITDEEKKLESLFGQSGSITESLSSGAHQGSNPPIKTHKDYLSNTVEDKGHRSQTKEPTNQTKINKNTTSLTAKSQHTTPGAVKHDITSGNSDSRNQVAKKTNEIKSSEARGTHTFENDTRQVIASTGALGIGHGLYREADFIYGHVKKEGIATGNTIEKETEVVVNSLKESKVVQETGADRLVTGAFREASFVGGLRSAEAKKVIESEKQNLDHLYPPGPSGVVLASTTEDTNKQQDKLAHQSQISTTEATSSIPEHISGEPRLADMAANAMEGAMGAAGSLASEAKNIDKKAKQGLEQTQKKSKGLLPIVMRLIRLVMRVAGKGKKSAANSQASSQPGSSASTPSKEEPSKGQRTAEGGGDAAQFASAAASAAMGAAAGGGGGKGGQIGAIIGVVVRLVRLASKLKGGQKDAPSAEINNSKLSVDSDDDEFFDCGEDFYTTEIETQTNEMGFFSVATQTPDLDRRPLMGESLESADETDVLDEESLSKELKSIALELQSVACENATASLNGLADRIRSIGADRTPLPIDDRQEGLDPASSTLDSTDPAGSTLDSNDSHNEKLKTKFDEDENNRQEPNKRITLDPSNRITLQILPSPIMGGARTEGSSSILIDIGGTAFVRAAPEPIQEKSDCVIIDNENTRKKQEEPKKYENIAQLERIDSRMYKRESNNKQKQSPLASPPSSPRVTSTSLIDTSRCVPKSQELKVDMHTPRNFIQQSDQTPNIKSLSCSYYKGSSPPDLSKKIKSHDEEKQHHTLRESRSHRTSTDSVNITVNPIVEYDSSTEDLSQDELVLYHPPSVVRFEDECVNDNIQRHCHPLKSAMKQRSDEDTRQYQRNQNDNDMQSVCDNHSHLLLYH